MPVPESSHGTPGGKHQMSSDVAPLLPYMKRLNTCSFVWHSSAIFILQILKMHTRWPFNSPRCWNQGLAVLHLIDWGHLQKQCGGNLCPVGVWQPSTNSKLAPSQAGCPRIYNRNILCLFLNVAHVNFPLPHSPDTASFWFFSKMPLHSLPIPSVLLF